MTDIIINYSQKKIVIAAELLKRTESSNRFYLYLIIMVDNARKVTTEWLSCRDVLWYLVFCGFAINSMQKANLSLAIVAMVIPRPTIATVSQCTYEGQQVSNTSSSLGNASSVIINITEHNVAQNSTSFVDIKTRPANIIPESSVQYPDRFAWNEYEQGLALGGSFWIQWATQLPGGLLARRYGTKLIFGWGNLATALLGFLIPLCARYHLYAFVILRVFQGFFTGFVWPSVHNMTAKWIPPDERGKFISSYIGSSVGIAMTYPLGAFLINWFGWDSVFYVTSTLGVIWYTCMSAFHMATLSWPMSSLYIPWYYLAYDTPHDHPRISEAEKTYIVESLGYCVDHNYNSQPIPWRAILTSGPLWITAIATCGGSWGSMTLASEAPSYFSYIHKWNISVTGVLVAVPHLMRMVFSYIFSSFADWLLRKNKMSVTNLRKFAMLVCNGVQGILWLGLAFSGCNSSVAIVCMIAGTAISGSLCSGTLASLIDLSPNYASILSGICNIATVTPGFISPLIVGILTNKNQTIEQWRLVFLITVAIILSTGILYLFFGTSDLQPWNSPMNKEKEATELEKLRSNSGEIECDKISTSKMELEHDTPLVQRTGNCFVE